MKTIIQSLIFIITFQVMSQNLIWQSEIQDVYSFSSPRAVDLNSDGTEDIILGAGIDGTYSESGFLALNGNTGDLLWSLPSNNQIYGSPIFNDVTGDGVMDIFMGGRNAEFRAINGATGNMLWEFYDSDAEIDPIEAGYYNFYNPQWLDDVSGDGVKDILISNGGDHAAPIFETDRPPGYVMIIDGLTGAEIVKAMVPDEKETYFSPLLIDRFNDGSLEVIFGTGGEFIEGSLWIVSLQEVINGDISNATELLQGFDKGMIAPPALADITADNVLDIIINTYDGRMIAFDGIDFNQLWQYNVIGAETNSTPGIGHFNNDGIPDVFSTFAIGVGPSFNGFEQFMIDGATGDLLWQGAFGTFHFSSPLVYDIDNDGIDEVIQSINEMEDNGSFGQSVLVVDPSDFSTSIVLGPLPGICVNSTPLLYDIDQNGDQDLILVRSSSTLSSELENGILIERYAWNVDGNENPVLWGAYMGSNYNGIYNNPLSNCASFNELSFNITNMTCENNMDGSITVISSGCENPNDCSYLWSDGQQGATATGLGAGEIWVHVTHPDGCVQVKKTKFIAPELEGFTFQVNPATCNFSFDGSINVNTTVDTSNWTFHWTSGSFDMSQTDIPAGDYNVIITTDEGCLFEESFTVPFNYEMILTTGFENISCAGMDDGFAYVNADASSEIVWENFPEMNSEDTLKNLIPGNYTVTVTDNEGCATTEQFDITEPEPLLFSGTATAVYCPNENNGSVAMNFDGGSPPYYIQWNDNPIEQIFSSIYIRTNLEAGSYAATLIDDHGCEMMEEFVVEQPSFNIEYVGDYLGSYGIIITANNFEPNDTLFVNNEPYEFGDEIWASDENFTINYQLAKDCVLDSLHNVNTSSVDEISLINTFIVNPSQSPRIFHNQQEISNTQIQFIMDVNGRKIEGIGNGQEYGLLPTGIYFVVCNINNERIVLKWVKE